MSSRHRIVINRVTTNSMEPRGCIGDYDPPTTSTRSAAPSSRPIGTRSDLAGAISASRRPSSGSICDNMGGGFGMKGGCYPEYALALLGGRGDGTAGQVDLRAQRGRS